MPVVEYLEVDAAPIPPDPAKVAAAMRMMAQSKAAEEKRGLP